MNHLMQLEGKKTLRALSLAETDLLEANGCSAEDWSLIRVTDDFTADNICRCRFKGRVNIGRGVTIKDIGSYIANYNILDEAQIINVGVLETNTSSTFGNGTKVATINENGGRSISIYDQLTAQAAYVTALYRHRPQTVEALEAIALRYAESVRSDMGTIGEGAVVSDCKIVRNVRIGQSARVVGASILSNGTILSTPTSPAVVGIDAKLYDFIACDGSHIDNSSLLHRCFVGQSVIIENLTATDSLMFANSHLENCEACSIFAGPFTVSHHSSSLLIAGLFSFFNAGSGTNQSNHLFRTGAVHQGIHLRGVKFGSDAYTMLPCRNGAFTVIVGRHRNHADTDDFPYSYLVDKEGASYLMPGRNLMSYGTVRDLGKWANRDRRVGSKRDNINFEECNPYVGSRFLKALNILGNLTAEDGPEIINWGRMKLTRKSAWQGAELYRSAADKYIAHALAQGCTAKVDGRGEWIDCAGQFMPLAQMNAILERVDEGKIASAEDLEAAFDEIMVNYRNFAYDWALGALENRLQRPATEQDIAVALVRGQKAEYRLKEITEADKMKDFDEVAKVGYGIDSTSEADRQADFEAVRGGN